MRQRLRPVLLALALTLVVGAFRFLSLSGFNNDHYVHFAAAQQIAMGEWPSRDYVELGLPLMELLSAVPFWLFRDAPLFGEALLVAMMFALAAVFTLYAARRLTASWWIALLVVALEVVIFPRTYSYPKVLAYAAGLLAMWRYVDRPSLSRMLQLAIAVVVAFGLRYDHGIYVGIGGLLTVVAVSMPLGRVETLSKAASFAGIVLLLVMPYVVYLQVHEGFWQHIVRGIDLQAVESSRGRTIPAFTFDNGLFVSNAVPWLFFVFHLLPVAAAIAVWVCWRQQGWRERAAVVPLIVVALLANFGLIRDTVSARLPDAVVPVSMLLGWLVAVMLRLRPSPARSLTWIAAATVVVFTMASATAVGATKEQLEKAEMLGSPVRLWGHVHSRIAQLHERFPASQMPSRVVARLVPFLHYVDRCLGPRDHILIPGFAPEVAVWSRRPFAGGQIWFQPELLSSDEDHRLVMSRLQVQRVPVAVLLLPSSDALAASFPELGRYLRDHFPEMTPLEGDEDERVTIAFDPQIAVGRDHDTGWYCYR